MHSTEGHFRPQLPLFLAGASVLLLGLTVVGYWRLIPHSLLGAWMAGLLVSMGLGLGATRVRWVDEHYPAAAEICWRAHGLLWGLGCAWLLLYRADMGLYAPLLAGPLLALLALREFDWPPWRLFCFQALLLVPSSGALLLVPLLSPAVSEGAGSSLGLAALLQLACLAALAPDRQGGVLRFPSRRRLEAQAVEYTQLQREKRRALKQVAHFTELSRQDSLTELANRRLFNEFLLREWRRACRTKMSLALIMADIDEFKRYNDCYGHVAGDSCLRDVSGVLRSYGRRGGDLAARYGGEEFAVILAETSLDAAGTIAERIRLATAELRLPHETARTGPFVSLSLGVASMQPSREQKPRDLVELADQALYQAKREGRDQVVICRINTAPGTRPAFPDPVRAGGREQDRED